MTPSPAHGSVLPRVTFPIVVAVLAAANIIVYLVQLSQGVHWKEPLVGDLLAWGGNAAPLTLIGQPWRLLTSVFLHGGLVHLAVNMYMLITLGPYVERAFGKVRFGLVYLLTGLFGSLVTALWHAHHKVSNPDLPPGMAAAPQLELVVGVGASGALMGICGAMLGHILCSGIGERDRHSHMKSALVQTIGLTLVLGFIVPGIGNAAHIGGVVAGLAIGVLFARCEFPTRPAVQALATAIISLAALAIIQGALSQPPSSDLVALRHQVDAALAAPPNSPASH